MFWWVKRGGRAGAWNVGRRLLSQDASLQPNTSTTLRVRHTGLNDGFYALTRLQPFRLAREKD